MGELTKLGKYEILSTLGKGAMGVVYKGFDPHIERTVALKTIRKDALSPEEIAPLLSRFKQEAQAAGRLTHPGIVTVYEYGEDAGTVYIAMEFVQGRELKEILNNNERLQLSTTVNLITQLLDALAYSHAHGVVHRDIKPGNIFILKDHRVKVTDFGIAKIESSTLTQFGDVLGTPSCMSPEQFSGQPVDRRSDLFSVGVILYQLLTGEKPFPGNSMATIMHRILNTTPPNVSDLNFQISAGFDEVINKALAKKASERFQTAAEFAAALKSAYQYDAGNIAENAADELMLDYAAHDEATINQPNPSAAAVTARRKPPVEPNTDRQGQREKIVDGPRSGAPGAPLKNRFNHPGRRMTPSILVLIVTLLCSYVAWLIYSATLDNEGLQPPVKEYTEGPGRLAPGSPTKEEVVPEPAKNLEKRVENKPGSETVSPPPRISQKTDKLPDKAEASKPAPAKKAPEPPEPDPERSALPWP